MTVKYRVLMAAPLLAAGALALTGTTGSTATARQPSPIKHVVVIYLENHSFDSLLGFWCDKVDAGTIHRTDGCAGMPPSVTLSDGTVVVPGKSPNQVPEVNHNVSGQVAAIDGGKMDGWQHLSGCTAPTYSCISGYEPSQIPNITTLARKYAISDATFSLADSPSWGGHIAIAAGQMDGFLGDNPGPKGAGPGWGCDSNKITPWHNLAGKGSLQPSCVPDFSLDPVLYPNGGAFKPTQVAHIPTIMDSLDAAGLTWKLYGATSTQKGYIWSICPTFADCLDTGQVTNLVSSTQFVPDATAGNLPAFSIVTPGDANYTNACHNGMSVKACDNWLGQLVSAVMSGPDWSSTAIFVTWDDCGCFYDQVPPGIGTGWNPGRAAGAGAHRLPVRPPGVHRFNHDDLRGHSGLYRAELRPHAARAQRRAGLPVHQCVQLHTEAAGAGEDGPPPAAGVGQAAGRAPPPRRC